MFYLNKILKPKKKINLKRVGGKNDGGYLLNLDNINSSNFFYSFGVGLNWSFEENIYQIKKDQNVSFQISMFDHTIGKYFWFKNFVVSFIELIRFKKKFLYYLKQYFKLKKFLNNKECFLYDLMINPLNLDHAKIYKLKVTDLNKIFEGKDKKRDSFIKVDIEGAEYRILDQLIKYNDRFYGCIIEFHDIDLNLEKIKIFIEKFKLDLIHTHVNNCGPLMNKNSPTQVELTFSYLPNKSDYEFSENFDLPHELDMPNHPNLRDDDVSFV